MASGARRGAPGSPEGADAVPPPRPWLEPVAVWVAGGSPVVFVAVWPQAARTRHSEAIAGQHSQAALALRGSSLG